MNTKEVIGTYDAEAQGFHFPLKENGESGEFGDFRPFDGSYDPRLKHGTSTIVVFEIRVYGDGSKGAFIFDVEPMSNNMSGAVGNFGNLLLK